MNISVQGVHGAWELIRRLQDVLWNYTTSCKLTRRLVSLVFLLQTACHTTRARVRVWLHENAVQTFFSSIYLLILQVGSCTAYSTSEFTSPLHAFWNWRWVVKNEVNFLIQGDWLMYKVGNTELVKQVAPEKVFNLRSLELCVQQFQVKKR